MTHLLNNLYTCSIILDSFSYSETNTFVLLTHPVKFYIIKQTLIDSENDMELKEVRSPHILP